MPATSIFGEFEPVVAAGTAAAGTVTVLPFKLQTQLQSAWCWAAVSASVCEFLKDVGDSAMQCKLATKYFPVECCLDPMPDYNADWPGNRPYALDAALQDAGHAVGTSGDLRFSGVQQQIDNRKPICCHIRYPGDPLGHFLVITGYDANGEQIIVQDPERNSPHSGTFPIAQFNASVGGTWDRCILIL